MYTNPPNSLEDFLIRLDERVICVIEGARFERLQTELLCGVADKANVPRAGNLLADPMSIFYLICAANARQIDDQGQELALFLRLYILAAGLFDDIQDDELATTPCAEVGAPIAINTALTLLFLGLDALRRGMEYESDPDRRLEFLKLVNETSLLAVAGQHCDLMGAGGARTPEQVLVMHKNKTSTPSLLLRTAAAFSHCSPDTQILYGRIGENFAHLAQIVDDVRDLYGKALSPDLMTGKMTFPIACFLESADPAQSAEFERLRSSLPDSARSIRELLHRTGVISRAATTIEGYRREIHRDMARTENFSSAHRTLLFVVDGLSQLVYRTPRIPETMRMFAPETAWHERVRSLARNVLDSLAAFDPPPLPPFVPWHLPHWMYHPETGVIYYPDMEGQPEETLRFQGMLLGERDLEIVRAIVDAQVPVLVAHELFHYWRDCSNKLSTDMWREEVVANTLAMAYCRSFEPAALTRVVELMDNLLSLSHNQLTARSQAILDDLLCESPDRPPSEYGVDLHQMALIQMAMVQRLIKNIPDLASTVRVHLTPAKRALVDVEHGEQVVGH